MFMDFPAKVVGQAGGRRSPKGHMKSRRPEVSINHENTTVRLADNGLCEICSDKRLPFRRNTACDEDALQLARISNLREPRPESSKRLGPDFPAVVASEHAHARIRRPFRMGAPLYKLFELDERVVDSLFPPVSRSCVVSVP